MQSAALKRRATGRRWALAALATLAALTAGVVAAYTTAPRPLLDVAPNVASQVPKQDNVRMQYIWARTADTQSPELYEAVWKYFPASDGMNRNDRALYARFAKRDLARYYYVQPNLDASAQLYRELTEITDEGSEVFLIAGRFGLANIAHKRGDVNAERTNLNRAAEMLAAMPDGQLSADDRSMLMSILDQGLHDKLEQTVAIFKELDQLPPEGDT
jgi:hypothetical protein